MKRVVSVLAAGLLVAACSSSGSPDAGASGAPAASSSSVATPARPFGVVTATETFVDTTRPTRDAEGNELAPDRTLLTDVYVPEGPGPFPLIVFSHGAQGHPRKFTELLRSWAQAGYVVAAPRFPLTSDEADPFVLGDVVNQPADVSFVISRALETVPVADPARIGVAGLSLGGVTTYGVAFHDCCRDDRIDAVIVMSGARLPFGGGEYDFTGLPFLLLHGTADPLIPYAEAEAAYAAMAAPKYFVTLQDGSHAPPYENTPSPHDEVVARVTLDFWDAYLLGDDGAEARIMTDAAVAGIASGESAR